jgi:hypothetical protein
MLHCYAGVRDKGHVITSKVDNYRLVSCPLVFFLSSSSLSQRFIVIFPSNHTRSTITPARTPVDLVLG